MVDEASQKVPPTEGPERIPSDPPRDPNAAHRARTGRWPLAAGPGGSRGAVPSAQADPAVGLTGQQGPGGSHRGLPAAGGQSPDAAAQRLPQRWPGARCLAPSCPLCPRSPSSAPEAPPRAPAPTPPSPPCPLRCARPALRVDRLWVTFLCPSSGSVPVTSMSFKMFSG